jgi:hypothetical protein
VRDDRPDPSVDDGDELDTFLAEIVLEGVETMLLRDHLAPPEVRPDLDDCVWIEDVPCGPSPEGIRQLRKIQEHYGSCHVTTGNASGAGSDPPPPWATGMVCGVYVRADVVARSPNFPREYLS